MLLIDTGSSLSISNWIGFAAPSRSSSTLANPEGSCTKPSLDVLVVLSLITGKVAGSGFGVNTVDFCCTFLFLPKIKGGYIVEEGIEVSVLSRGNWTKPSLGVVVAFSFLTGKAAGSGFGVKIVNFCSTFLLLPKTMGGYIVEEGTEGSELLSKAAGSGFGVTIVNFCSTFLLLPNTTGGYIVEEGIDGSDL
ncbi:unnamed protein product [Acanthoscelides obtectus]|uniref:Uncharacterized protein n=1 Tax=Acanthoscelides obtectus TaxID=200917 RepID=A0A9P0NXI6_ACAOB|nr:unnamed protein product [Acanthoscelides obtectus]CAK1638142.1 hypothetical protein AOBTE_LOCUS10408 [Acanthoscelides obtectus]